MCLSGGDEIFYLSPGDEKNINFNIILYIYEGKIGMTDGTKTDNGICIQTMPTRNYFTFSMERKSDT